MIFASRSNIRSYGGFVKRCLVCLTMAAMLSFMALAATDQTSYAKVLTENEVPVYNEPTLDEFMANTDEYTEFPEDVPQAAFSVRLQKGWYKVIDDTMEVEEDQEMLNKRIYGHAFGDKLLRRHYKEQKTGKVRKFFKPIVTYYSPDKTGLQSRFTVVALEMEQEQTARDWLYNYVFVRGDTLEALTSHSDNEVEAIHMSVINGIAYVVRIKAIINGDRVILASYAVPETRWAEERGYQDKSVYFFELTNQQSDDVRLTETKTYSFFNRLTFEYPSYWSIRAPGVDSLMEMEASLMHLRDDRIIDGRIDILLLAHSRKSLIEGRINAIKESVEVMGLSAGNLIERRTEYDFHPRLTTKTIEVYQATDIFNRHKKLLDHELWIALLSDGEFYYLINMLTPGRSEDKRVWTLNAEAFKIVLESMEI